MFFACVWKYWSMVFVGSNSPMWFDMYRSVCSCVANAPGASCPICANTIGLESPTPIVLVMNASSLANCSFVSTVLSVCPSGIIIFFCIKLNSKQ